MDTKFSLIKQAQQISTTQDIIAENINLLAAKGNMTAIGLAESITHVLAGLAQNPQLLNINSISALMAGVEKLASGLISSQDEQKKQTTLRNLAAAAMKGDQLTKQSLPNHSVIVIAQFGAKFPELVQKYAKIANNPSQLSASLKQLQYTIDKAMNKAGNTNTISTDPASAGSVAPSASGNQAPSATRPASAHSFQPTMQPSMA